MSEIVTIRDIDTITTEIKTIEMQVSKMAIYGCIEIGRRLVEAKEVVGHGGWGKYLEESVRYSQQWATNLMNLYKEYGHHQESMFESFANSESFGNIDVTKHILLLAVPAEDRAEFVEINDVENKSVRELKEALRQRDKAIKDRDSNLEAANQQAARAEKAEAEVERLTAGIVEQVDKLEAKDAELERLQGQVKAAEDKQAVAEKKVETLKKKLKAATDGEAQARADLVKAKENPEVPESVMEQLRREVEADAAAKATEQVRKELAVAQEEADKANRARQAAEEKVATVQRKLQVSNPDMVEFGIYLTAAQDNFNKMVGALKKIAFADPATGEKLKGNVQAKLLDNLRKAVDMV